MDYTLPETKLIKIIAEEKDNTARFIIEPLSPGYGVTIGNSLRRVLLSSLEGAAVSRIKIEGITHEFTAVNNMREDVVDLILNLKALRLKLHNPDGATIKLTKKGPGEVKAKDFAANPEVEIIDPEHYLGTLEKGATLTLEARVLRGKGYVPAEQQVFEKVPLGEILIDSIYTPVKKVHFEVQNTRVGGATNYDKLSLEITTDGSLTPKEALAKSANILLEHFEIIRLIVPTGQEEKSPGSSDSKTKSRTRVRTKKAAKTPFTKSKSAKK